MTKKDNILRDKAIRLLSQKTIDYDRWGDDVKSVIEELSIYQIELEHQNEALEQAQADAQTAMMNYISLFENAPVGYLIMDANHTIKNVNFTLCSNLHIDQEDLIGQQLEKFVVPSFQDTLYHFFKSIKGMNHRAVIETKMSFNGLSYFVRIHASCIKECTDIQLALIDITLQKQLEMRISEESRKLNESEMKFRKLVEQSQNIIMYMNLRTRRIEYISPRVCDVLGFTPDEMLRMTSDTLKAQLLPEYRHLYDELMEQLLNNKKTNEYRHFKMRNKRGEIRDMECYFAPTAMPDQPNGMVIGYLQDVTDKLNHEKQLVSAMNKAQESEKLKTAFLANMSHEIRTPLNAIVGFSELLETTEDNTERQLYVNMINKNNTLLISIINDILDLSRLESGSFTLHLKSFDMVEQFDELFASFDKRNFNPKVKMQKECSLKRCVINSDEKRIMQILSNFTSNAMKYTREGTIAMGLNYEDNGILIYVRDTGIGIPEEKQSLIFGRFVKLDTFAQGTGLGLAICKAITEQLNGKIGFESDPEVGSRFWTWIPCKDAVVEAIV